jgi:hypothetical protein
MQLRNSFERRFAVSCCMAPGKGVERSAARSEQQGIVGVGVLFGVVILTTDRVVHGDLSIEVGRDAVAEGGAGGDVQDIALVDVVLIEDERAGRAVPVGMTALSFFVAGELSADRHFRHDHARFVQRELHGDFGVHGRAGGWGRWRLAADNRQRKQEQWDESTHQRPFGRGWGWDRRRPEATTIADRTANLRTTMIVIGVGVGEKIRRSKCRWRRRSSRRRCGTWG